MLKQMVKKLYNAVVPENEQRQDALAKLTLVQHQQISSDFLKVAGTVVTDPVQRGNIIKASEYFLASTKGYSSFEKLAFDYTQYNAPHGYFVRSTLVSILNKYQSNPADETTLIEVKRLELKISEAHTVKNFVKRRSVVRDAVKADYPNIVADDLGAVVELLLQL